MEDRAEQTGKAERNLRHRQVGSPARLVGVGAHTGALHDGGGINLA